jgi:ribosome-associated translation inhibitor RaiA
MTTNVEPIKITGLVRDPLRGRVTRLMTEAIAKLAVAPVGGQASFFDDNGPKGGRAMRCALTVRLPFRPSIRVERSAVTSRLAFDATFAVLERQLERYRERDRDNKRHPKKYFAARRAVASGPPAPRRRARTSL